MKIKTVLTVVAFLIVSVVLVSAEDLVQKNITLKECLVRAYKATGAMTLQTEAVLQSGEKVKQAGSSFLPSVDFYSKKTFQDNSNNVGGEYTETKFTAVESLFNGLKDSRSVTAASLEKNSQELTLLSIYTSVSKDVATAYYSAAHAQSDIHDAEENIQILQNRLTELNERVRLGKSRDTEVYSVESKLAAIRAQLEVAKGAKISALAQLALLIGDNVSNIDVVDDTSVEVVVPPLNDVLVQAQNRSDIKALLENIKQQNLRVKIAQGNFLPMLSMIGNYYLLRPPSATDASWDAMLALDFPLFQGGIDASKVREESSKLRAAQSTADYAKRQVEAEIRVLHSNLTASVGQLTALKESYDKADAAYRSLVKEYRLGLVNNLDVLAGISDLLDAKSSYNKSKIQLQQDNAFLLIALQQF